MTLLMSQMGNLRLKEMKLPNPGHNKARRRLECSLRFGCHYGQCSLWPHSRGQVTARPSPECVGWMGAANAA